MTLEMRLLAIGALVPDGFILHVGESPNGLCASLRGVDEEGNEIEVGGVTSSPPNLEAFTNAVEQLVRSRFDASYDECEWQARPA